MGGNGDTGLYIINELCGLPGVHRVGTADGYAGNVAAHVPGVTVTIFPTLPATCCAASDSFSGIIRTDFPLVTFAMSSDEKWS